MDRTTATFHRTAAKKAGMSLCVNITETPCYGIHNPVWYEPRESMESAIQREKRLKEWKRKWKMRLIESAKKSGKIKLNSRLGEAIAKPNISSGQKRRSLGFAIASPNLRPTDATRNVHVICARRLSENGRL